MTVAFGGVGVRAPHVASAAIAVENAAAVTGASSSACTVNSGVSGCATTYGFSLTQDLTPDGSSVVTGYTAALTGSFSFPATCNSPGSTGFCSSSSGASGSGTYTIKAAGGTIVQQGNFTSTGSSSVRFFDERGRSISSCSTSFQRTVTVPVSLTDSISGSSGTGSITIASDGGVYFVSNLIAFTTLVTSESFMGGAPTVAC
ncbi:MAG: hypothetical protein JOZ41_13645 [Chloroflexi bacterium]|nr:hypothetical protein [Chloroflexota bacterium]